MSNSSDSEIPIKRGELTVAKWALLFTALGTIVASAVSIADYVRGGEESAYKRAELEYAITVECIPQEKDYYSEKIEVVNNGLAVADNVRIVMKDTGVEVLSAESIPPYGAIAPHVYTQTYPMVIEVPTLTLNPGQRYELSIHLSKYGGIDASRIMEMLQLQKENLEITTSTSGPNSQDKKAPGDIRPIKGIPLLRTHKVSSGETVDSIAKEAGLTTESLIQYNPLLIYEPLAPGKVLITQPATCGDYSSFSGGTSPIRGQHVVGDGESIFCIARAYGVNPWDLLAVNNIGYPYKVEAGQVISVTAPTPLMRISLGPKCTPQFNVGACRFWHIVERGQTLPTIAETYGVSIWQIAQVNGIYNLNQIYAGNALCIP